ncbi:v-type ATPase subunit C [Fibrobacteres bacterium R8-0-B4]
MPRNYYYLVAGLPELLREESKNIPPFRLVAEEIKQELVPSDFQFVRAMTLPIDNRNLANILTHGSEEFDPRGNFTKEELSKGSVDLPEYMQVFLAAHKENRQIFAGLTPLDQLTWLFYEEMSTLNNPFVREWFDFEISLRNVIVGLNVRKGLGHIEAIATERDRPIALTLVGRGEAAEAVLRSSSPDFGLSTAFPWIDKVIALSKGGLTDMEKGIDDLRWDVLNDLTMFIPFFHVETVAAFVQKLLIVERWMKLEPVAGKARLDKLIDEMMKSFVMPEGF